MSMERREDVACWYSLLWSHWAGLHASAAVSQCLCVPAGLPGVEVCNQAVRVETIQKNIRSMYHRVNLVVLTRFVCLLIMKQSPCTLCIKPIPVDHLVIS